jgi:adenylate kinase
VGELIVLMGPTGAGKSVQGDLLAQSHGWVHLSSGKLLRADSHAQASMVDGRLAPPDEVHRVVGEAMAQVPESTPVVLDGTPRTQYDVDWLDERLPSYRRTLKLVLLIELDIETSMKRLGLRGRADDAPDAVREKWKLFDDVTGPIAQHYRELGLLRAVDGRGSIEQVHEQIETALLKAIS